MAGLLRKFVKAWSEVPVEPYSIIIDDQPVIVNFRRNSRAKRIILRLTRDATGVAVTIPKNMNASRALAFVDKSVPWISKHLKQRRPETVLGQALLFRCAASPMRFTPARRAADSSQLIPMPTVSLCPAILPISAAACRIG